MGWIDQLRGKKIAVDTAPLIYYVEENPTFFPVVDPFFEALYLGELDVITSTVTVAEALVHPIRQHNAGLIALFKNTFRNTPHLRVVPCTSRIAEIAASLRAEHRTRTPDAIQLATAIAMKADFFLTNDAELPELSSPKIVVLKHL